MSKGGIVFQPESEHLPAGIAICAECLQQDTVKHSEWHGISTQVFAAPDGSCIGRYLHRGECDAKWRARYWTYMRTHHPERAAQWDEREKQDVARREAGKRKRGQA